MKQYSDNVKSVAKDLRSQGYTYREICSYLNEKIPKSTLNGWIRHVPTPPWYQEKIDKLSQTNIKRIHELAALKNKEILISRLEEIRTRNISLINLIDLPVAKLILSTLYWCEGNKYPSSKYLKFGNSDQKMISLFITLLRLCYKLDESKFRMTVQCRADQDQTTLGKYWEEITKIPSSQHYSPRVDSRSIGKPTQKQNYRGVCVIDYFDSDLQCELQFTGELLGSIDSINLVKNQVK
ncbi:MAG: hypothetical protein WAV40_04735 [Microgenomates group bacterium]